MSEINENQDDIIEKRLNRVLETYLDNDKETLEALSDLSTFFTNNTLQTRRNLRSQIEKRSVSINENFLSAFHGLKLSLDSMCGEIKEMSKSINNMKENLRNSQALTHGLIQQTNTLLAESEKIQIRQNIANAFMKRFQLSQNDHKILYGISSNNNDSNVNKDGPITPEFFKILDNLQAIHSDCKILMQYGYQTAALDIMEEMTLHQEYALERLYRWTQNHCRNIDSNEIGGLVIEAMSRLQDRSVLFKYIIDEYANARRQILVRMFIDALTVGGAEGNTKPIETHAHDPKRYIGDMFAWLHQAIPTEKENLIMLLKLCDKNDLSDQMQTALSQIVDGVCHPLKVRVETILNSEKDAIVLFAISNLLRFYQNIICQVIKSGNLKQCLNDLQKHSEQAYLNALSYQVKLLLKRPVSQKIGLELPQRDLVPPSSVGKLLNLLKEILSVASMVEERQSDITNIVSCIIDPLLQSVTESASHLPTVDMSVYMLNCLYHMQSTLTMFEYMDDRIERIQAQSDAQIDTLTSEQASSLVANLNLGPIYTILQNNQVKIELNLLKMFVNKLDTLLEMPDMFLLPQINLLMSTRHRKTVQKRAFSVIIAIYKQIYQRIYDPENGYENPQSILCKTPDEVSAILMS